ncbi:MAG TPA: metalloregulator ArsR/SmtB family transcription factor [Geopsychrobacteraceae bacterium]|nr:metalloregulator ArsR/SmtB family transcription factor [Geopsychrobacteraceae bacterium]
MNQDICQVNIIHENRITVAKEQMPQLKSVTQIASIFKLLGDPTRLRIMLALNASEMCVCDLAALLETTPSAVSHQLRLLRTAGLVHARKEGKIVYYNLEEPSTQGILREGLLYLEAK